MNKFKPHQTALPGNNQQYIDVPRHILYRDLAEIGSTLFHCWPSYVTLAQRLQRLLFLYFTYLVSVGLDVVGCSGIHSGRVGTNPAFSRGVYINLAPGGQLSWSVIGQSTVDGKHDVRSRSTSSEDNAISLVARAWATIEIALSSERVPLSLRLLLSAGEWATIIALLARQIENNGFL